MNAMQRRLGPFEVPLTDLEPLGTTDAGRNSFRFRLLKSNDKLIPGMECSLRFEGGEELVTIVGLERISIRLACDRRLSLSRGPASLVIYPWFLYERLILALESLLESRTHFPQSSFRVFGKHPPEHAEAQLQKEHGELNESQLAALRLCCDNSLAFVWGPPGTGKTTTLAHIVDELVSQELRVLVTSTTNAAVDQAKDALLQRPSTDVLLARGEILRIGKSEIQSFDADVGETVKRFNSTVRSQIRVLNEEKNQLERLNQGVVDLLSGMEPNNGTQQLTLFEELPALELDAARLSGIIPGQEIPVFLDLPIVEQTERLRALSTDNVGRVRTIDERVATLGKERVTNEAEVITNARIILATMATIYVNRSLSAERFDAVVIEEAGMAVLPAVFYCASLARDKVILIGDPRQLPSIVHSSEAYVQKAMARSIFEVTVPDLKAQPAPVAASDTVESAYLQTNVQPGTNRASLNLALLNLQYRMHPAIGNLVSELYYDGKLKNASILEERTTISTKMPFPHAPLVLLDSGNFGRCEMQQGSYSRFNRSTAQLCVRLAADAVGNGLSSVAVITPYVEQSRLIRTLLRERRLKSVECRTVHRFQGHERDLVILDTVDGEPYTPGVLLAGDSLGSSAANLLNVSISRARGKLIVISDLTYFRKNAHTKPIGRLLDAISNRELVISAREVTTEKMIFIV